MDNMVETWLITIVADTIAAGPSDINRRGEDLPNVN